MRFHLRRRRGITLQPGRRKVTAWPCTCKESNRGYLKTQSPKRGGVHGVEQRVLGNRDENAVVFVADQHFHHGSNSGRSACSKISATSLHRCVAAARSTFGKKDVIGAGRVAVTSRDEFSDVSAH
jgi:hypothetical protein